MDYAVDELVEALLDVEFEGVVPFAVQGDGNCLFHAASLLVLGKEGHHAQLRSMVVSELEEHAAFYADGFVTWVEYVRVSDKTLSHVVMHIITSVGMSSKFQIGSIMSSSQSKVIALATFKICWEQSICNGNGNGCCSAVSCFLSE